MYIKMTKVILKYNTYITLPQTMHDLKEHNACHVEITNVEKKLLWLANLQVDLNLDSI